MSLMFQTKGLIYTCSTNQVSIVHNVILTNWWLLCGTLRLL